MKQEDRIAKDLTYIFFKNLDNKKDKKVKKVVFCIEGNLNVDRYYLKDAFRKCVLNTPYEDIDVEFLYKYSVDFSENNPTYGISLHSIETED
ncbi:MAG: hypothetical protein RMJ67_07320 [Elusimicrobiota bacterium]|nr:hypothetical protein [Endomicrobiia bacterium]MDW8166302.1 hypothetical protein [Elusimicrobiota bacterium]